MQNLQNQETVKAVGRKTEQVEQISNRIEKWLYDSLLSQVTLLLPILLILVYKNILEPWRKKKLLSMSYTRKIEAQIEDAVQSALIYSNADRVLLVEASNGKYTLGGREIKSLIITCQKTAKSIHPIGADGFLTTEQTCISSLFKSLTNTPFCKRNVPEIEDSLYRLYMSSMAEYVAYQYLEINGQPLGFLAFHYCSSLKQMDFQSLDQWAIAVPVTTILECISTKKSILEVFVNSLKK